MNSKRRWHCGSCNWNGFGDSAFRFIANQRNFCSRRILATQVQFVTNRVFNPQWLSPEGSTVSFGLTCTGVGIRAFIRFHAQFAPISPAAVRGLHPDQNGFRRSLVKQHTDCRKLRHLICRTRYSVLCDHFAWQLTCCNWRSSWWSLGRSWQWLSSRWRFVNGCLKLRQFRGANI
ncbi:unannotated protein [freshwater metagenome]|uniref:Unannotated protein n=1 Tax=freshwater metagenome TaxID=449393 RepID=A0A6J7H250_9ZZZZ